MRKHIRDPRVGQQAWKFANDETPKRCNQCWKTKELRHFINPRTQKITQDCNDCRYNAKGGVKNHRDGLRAEEAEVRVRLTLNSGNRKTGKIPVSMTSSETCPPTCGFFNAGCYGEGMQMRHHWRQTPERGVDWEEFCLQVTRLPEGTLWRHNEVGDLPGVGLEIDTAKLRSLVLANTLRRGFTYTHKPLDGHALKTVRWANVNGFTINTSCDTLEQADASVDKGLPTTVVLPHTAGPEPQKTPKGRTIVVCPAVHNAVTCKTCQLCQRAGRKAIVGFPAHGIRKRLVSQIVLGNRPSLA